MSGRRDRIGIGSVFESKEKKVKIILCVKQHIMSKLDMKSSFCHQCLNVTLYIWLKMRSVGRC